LLETLYFSIPGLLNVTVILLTTCFVFSVIGHILFRDLLPQGRMLGINEVFNFDDFHHGFLSVVLWITGLQWTVVMEESLQQAGIVLVAYWVLLLLIVEFVLLHLYSLVMLRVFEENYVIEYNPDTLFSELEEDFVENWVKLSEQGAGFGSRSIRSSSS
jgi:hypothetical protein